MTTVELPPEAEAKLLLYKGARPENVGPPGSLLHAFCQIANALPDPPYVPEVGDLILAIRNDVAFTNKPERVIALTDSHVITRWHTDTDKTLRPEVYAYRTDAHTFEKVES